MSLDNEFSVATRQSPIAILLLIYKYFINVIRQFWPAIIAILIGRRSGNITSLIIISVSVIAISALLYAIAYYFRFTFKVGEEELLIEKGVFKKSKLNIPFGRIQTLNFEQGVLHQLFNVVKIDVDTAGSSKSEFTFNALEKNKAESLRKLVLEKKSQSENEDALEEIEITEVAFKENKGEKIFSLELKDLFIIGLSKNHLRTLILLFFFSFWGIGELDDAGIDVEWINMENLKELLSRGLIIITAITLILLVIVIIGTGIRTILNYYDFKMFRTSKGFKIQSGLLNRKEYAALDHKIQHIKWKNNPLKRLFRIHELELKQASSVEVSAKKSIKVPGIRLSQIEDVISYITNGKEPYSNLHFSSIDRRFLYRYIGYFAILPWICISAILYRSLETPYAFIPLILIPYLSIIYYVAYRKWKFAISDDIIYAHHGVYENKNHVIQLHKIQSVQIFQSPFQWRRSLANVKLYTASGLITIPYLEYDHAVALKNYILFKVESSEETWY